MDGREALRIIADEVVGMSNPDDVHDDEMLRWGKIREALQPPADPELEEEVRKIMRAPIMREDGSYIPAQRLCWNSGKGGHLCNKKCEHEPPYGTTLEDLVAEARESQYRAYAEWSDKQIKALYETRPKTIERGGRWI